MHDMNTHDRIHNAVNAAKTSGIVDSKFNIINNIKETVAPPEPWLTLSLMLDTL